MKYDLMILLLLLFLANACQRPCTEHNYTGSWQFTTKVSINQQSPYHTEQYQGTIQTISSDSIAVAYRLHQDYFMTLEDCRGTLRGDIYAGNHGWAYYKGVINDSVIQVIITSGSGFPPFDTTYQVIHGIRLP